MDKFTAEVRLRGDSESELFTVDFLLEEENKTEFTVEKRLQGTDFTVDYHCVEDIIVARTEKGAVGKTIETDEVIMEADWARLCCRIQGTQPPMGVFPQPMGVFSPST